MSTSSTFDSDAVTLAINPEAFAPLIATAVDSAIRRIRSEAGGCLSGLPMVRPRKRPCVTQSCPP